MALEIKEYVGNEPIHLQEEKEAKIKRNTKRLLKKKTNQDAGDKKK